MFHHVLVFWVCCMDVCCRLFMAQVATILFCLLKSTTLNLNYYNSWNDLNPSIIIIS